MTSDLEELAMKIGAKIGKPIDRAIEKHSKGFTGNRIGLKCAVFCDIAFRGMAMSAHIFAANGKSEEEIIKEMIERAIQACQYGIENHEKMKKIEGMH